MEAGLICNYANQPRRVSFRLGWCGHSITTVSQVLGSVLECTPEAHVDGRWTFHDQENAVWTLQLHDFSREGATGRDSTRGILLQSPLLPLYRMPLMDRIVKRIQALPMPRTARNHRFMPALFHICPEVTSLNTRHVLAHVQAFVLLFDWLQEQAQRETGHSVDLQGTAFSDDYAELVLREDYRPDMAQLVQHYRMYNRTPGHAFDLLPLLNFLDRQRSGATDNPASAPIMICRLSPPRMHDAAWSPTREWEKWLAVERLAMNDHLRRQMAAHYQGYSDRLMHIGPNWREDSALWLSSAA